MLLLVLDLEDLDLGLALALELRLIFFVDVLCRSLVHVNLDLPCFVVDSELVIIGVKPLYQLSHQDTGLEHGDEAVCRCLSQGQLFFLQVDDFVTFCDLSHLLFCFEVVRVAYFKGFTDRVLGIIVLARSANLLGPLAILVDLVPLEELLADFLFGGEFALQPLVADYICNTQALMRVHGEHRRDELLEVLVIVILTLLGRSCVVLPKEIGAIVCEELVVAVFISSTGERRVSCLHDKKNDTEGEEIDHCALIRVSS